jgi:hypothetical protein
MAAAGIHYRIAVYTFDNLVLDILPAKRALLHFNLRGHNALQRRGNRVARSGSFKLRLFHFILYINALSGFPLKDTAGCLSGQISGDPCHYGFKRAPRTLL